MAGQQISSGFVITVDGSALPSDVEQLLVEATTDAEITAAESAEDAAEDAWRRERDLLAG